MTNSRDKGKRAELDVVRYLENADWAAKRRLSGNGQAGDIMLIDAPHVVLDVKDRTEPRISAWLEQLSQEAAGRPCEALVWKQWSRGPDPGEWLAIVANEPSGWFQREVARPVTLHAPSLTAPVLRSALGWLDVEHGHRDLEYTLKPVPALYWQDWLLMRFSSFVDEVLPCWEGVAA